MLRSPLTRIAITAAVLAAALTPAVALARTDAPLAKRRAVFVRPVRPPQPPAPLSATITPGTDTGTVMIRGGVGPFTVSMLTDSGPLQVYSGAARVAQVPLVAGSTDFQITGGTETTIAAGVGDTRFWVADNVARTVKRFDALADTLTVSAWIPGDDTSSTVKMRNISVRPSDDHLFVVFSDEYATGNDRLIELDADGGRVATYTVPASYKIQDVTFDSANNMYVIDRGTGQNEANRVRITKLSPTGSVLLSTQTVLPPIATSQPQLIGYPMINLTTMIEYHAALNVLVARINTATFAILDPATLQVTQYRFGGDTCHSCMTLNSNVSTDVVLYTGGSGFNLPSFFGKQSGFLSDAKYLDPAIFKNPSHDWKVEPTLPAIADVAVDTNNFVYTIQHDGAGGLTRAYVVDPTGAPVKTVDLPGGTKIAVVR